MKKILLLISISLTTNILLAQSDLELNSNNICKKWYLKKYEVLFVNYSPKECQKKDMIHFKSDHTYERVDGGNYFSGKWKLDSINNTITLYNKEKKSVSYIIKKLNKNQLIYTVNAEDLLDVNVYMTLKE